jgi:hypothetical protein
VIICLLDGRSVRLLETPVEGSATADGDRGQGAALDMPFLEDQAIRSALLLFNFRRCLVASPPPAGGGPALVLRGGGGAGGAC